MIEARAKLIPGSVWMGNFPEQESAAKIRYHDRPVFRKLLAQLHAGDILIVWRLDRLERSMFGMVEVLGELNKRDIRLIVLQHAGAELDLNSTTGKILALFMAGMAEMENDQRRESTRNALQWRKDNGYVYNRVPFGWKKVPLKLRVGQNKPLKIAVPGDIATFEEIIARIDSGERVYSIAQDFFRRGMKWNGKPWAPRLKHGPLECNHIKAAYKTWKNSPLRVKRAMQADASSPSASSACPSEVCPSPEQDPSSPGRSEPPCP
jgi:DNA invertase Pin-like site-specific DNA recombinase